MNESEICPSCHVQVRPSDYFCYNCGKNLKSKPLPISIEKQALVYIGSILLPPMGLIWGIRYLREKGSQTKIIGIISIVLTLISLILVIIWTNNFIRSVQEQVNNQVNGFQGF